MGAWGPSLYADDTTSEIRDAFKTHLEAGLPHKEAEQRILARFHDVLADPQVACLVYFALAETLWRYGCLGDELRNRAVALIDAGGDVRYWREQSAAAARAREKVLRQLKERLLSAQPPLKQVAAKPQKPPKKQLSASVGAVFALDLPGGDTAVLKFVGLREGGAGREEAVFRVLPWRGRTRPSEESLKPLAEQVVLVEDYCEFSLLSPDGRKNPTARLRSAGIVLPVATRIDPGRAVAVNIDFLPEKVATALAGISATAA